MLTPATRPVQNLPSLRSNVLVLFLRARLTRYLPSHHKSLKQDWRLFLIDTQLYRFILLLPSWWILRLDKLLGTSLPCHIVGRFCHGHCYMLLWFLLCFVHSWIFMFTASLNVATNLPIFPPHSWPRKRSTPSKRHGSPIHPLSQWLG